VALTAADAAPGARAQAGAGRPRLMVLRALGLGDLLTAVPALRALARAFADHERLLAAPAALRPLVESIDAGDAPAVHRVVGVGELEPLPAELHGADVAVNLHGRGPQSHRLLLDARPRRCLWFLHPAVPQSAGAPEWRAGEHEVRRWCRMLAENGIVADPSELELTPPASGAARAAGATIVHPGAASPARRWPPERFAEVARGEAARGRRVLITGSAEERPLARSVARMAGLPGDCVLAGTTDLAELAGVVGAAGRVVCGDTGVGHLATAFGTPSVLLFGPTPPLEWGPPRERRQHRTLWAGRTGDPHGLEPDPGLLSITAREVTEALEAVAA
jgi:ADP-heptose:LPS heptosyltransferase